MQILQSIDALAEIRGPLTLSIGVFDGVHLGHQAVLRAAMEDAESAGGTAVAMTFDPHPARILRPDRAPRLLTSTPHKARLIEAFGLTHLLVVPFDAAFAAQPAEIFIRRLADAARPLRQICIGEQWSFGRGRAGNPELLRELGQELGFTVTEVSAVQVGGLPVSSTRIREAVEKGELATARILLGRDYTILGTVEHGDQLGRKIGFPTANLRAHNEQFPPDGVYAVRASVAAERFGGVANIGIRPTIVDGCAERRLEVHLFGFDGDLYGQNIDVDFLKWLREERKFSSLDALKAQILEDAAAARAIVFPPRG